MGSTKGQLSFLGEEPRARIIWGPGRNMSRNTPQLWFKWDGGWLRQEWAGQFSDGTPRPPWLDDQFMELWRSEGPDAAHDKSRYDLQDVTQMLASA